MLDGFPQLPIMGIMRHLLANLSARPVWLIVLLGLAVNLSGTWLLPLIDRDEPRFVEASREMGERSDAVVPFFNGTPRYDKPPLIYWAQHLSSRVFGESPFAARLPSALFATGTACLIFFWGRRLAPPRAALAAALIFMTCGQMAIHARLAVADMPMLFFFTAACWSGWEMTRPDATRRAGWWTLFYFSLALGFLAKGPIAWLPLGGLLLGRWRQPRQFNFSLASCAGGMVLMLALVGLWGIPALLQTHGDFLRVGLGYHVVFRSFGVLDGHGAGGVLGWIALSPIFFITFFLSFFPWAWRVPGGLRRWWPHRHTDVAGWYLLTQAGLVFLVFSIIRTKLPHYTLPAFPCLALWLATMAEDGRMPGLHAARSSGLMAGAIVTVTLAMGLTLRPYFVAHALFEKARPQLQPDMRIASVQFNEPSVVWEFRQILTNDVEFLASNAATNFFQAGQPAILILPTALYESNRTNWPGNLAVVQAEGVNWSRFQQAKLTALIRR